MRVQVTALYTTIQLIIIFAWHDQLGASTVYNWFDVQREIIWDNGNSKTHRGNHFVVCYLSFRRFRDVKYYSLHFYSL